MRVIIDNKEYIPLDEFADMTFRSISAIRHLMFNGNKIRKLKYVEPKPGKYYIPVEEYNEYPFTSSGKFSGGAVFHFDSDGKYVCFSAEEIDKILGAVGLKRTLSIRKQKIQDRQQSSHCLQEAIYAANNFPL